MNNERFMRTELILGQDGLRRLQEATVMIVGLGAVGGYSLEALARAGVGHLILVDFDIFDFSNINRQILALTSTVGQKKVEVARKRVLEINPECNVEIEDAFVNTCNLDKILNRKIDFVIDAIDSIKEKCDLISVLYQKKIPFISSMGAALKTDVSSLKQVKLSQTAYCMMAKKIRQTLKQKKIDVSKIDCVCSFEQTACAKKPIIKNPNGSKAILGSLSTVTAVMGLYLAHHVILKISQGKDDASGAKVS